MKNDDKTDWTFVLTCLIICLTILLSGAKCTYRPMSVELSNAG